jgi:hypothetical protein
VLQLENCCDSVLVNCCCLKLVAEAGNSSGTQRKGKVRLYKPLLSNDNEDVTLDNSLYV